MVRGILIAGNESSLFTAAAAEAAKRVESFAAAFIPGRIPNLPQSDVPKTELPAGAIPLSWKAASPISTRTTVLAAENRLGQINDAILICSPPAIFKSANDLSPEEIETFVNDHIKGWFFLIRELCIYFRRAASGSLSLVIPETGTSGKYSQADLLGPSAAASFRAFAQSVLAKAANEPFQLMGFSGAEAGAEEEFSSWLFKIIDEGSKRNSGRLQKYSKIPLFRSLTL